jgi:hypothetical protein
MSLAAGRTSGWRKARTIAGGATSMAGDPIGARAMKEATSEATNTANTDFRLNA